MYSSYVPKVNARNAIDADYSVDIYGQSTGSTYDIVIEAIQVAGTPLSNLVLHFVVTESGFPVSWGFVTEANYVCRLMVPDQNGTAIDFSTNTTQQINLQFTMDPTWDTDEVEFVSFIQDNTTKEILNGNKVHHDNLIPFQATAAFSAQATSICETNSVQYYDNSMGNVISWNWTFEGGTPATSTDQNPVVTYNTAGDWDVTLEVSDGSVTDILTEPDFMAVSAIPAQPDTPNGPAEACQSGTFDYTTNDVLYATSYTWEVDPASAGSMSGTGTTGTLTPSGTYTGAFNVRVRAENSCGDGVWSNDFGATMYTTPTTFTLSQGGGYCVGSQGIELTLSGSEVDTDYELMLDGNPTGIIVAGTGSSISFGYQTDEGIYTCIGYTDYCQNEMIGNSWIYPIEEPGQAALPYGPESVCNDETGVIYSTNGAPDAETYIWELTPKEAGVVTGTGVDATVDFDPGFTGAAQLVVTGENDCGLGLASDPLNITVNDTPEPVISGLTLVCNDEEATYSTTENTGSTYTWNVTGGTIIAGAGTHEITVKWGAPGMGYVNVTEENADGCSTTTADFEVTIDDCTGIEELTTGVINVYPNPVHNSLNVSMTLKKDQELSIYVMNQLGQVVQSLNSSRTAGDQIITLSTENLKAGVYSVKIVSEEGLSLQKKFLKVDL